MEDGRADGEAVRTLLCWLSGAWLGEARSLGGLGLVPVHAETERAMGYRTLAEALADGSGAITEKPQASVPTLQVRNRGGQPVLLLDGEEVVGDGRTGWSTQPCWCHPSALSTCR